MDREQVAAALDEIARLLELHGDNPFKIRAYDNAARLLGGLDGDLGDLVRRNALTGIKGIGAALAEVITSLVEDGRLEYLDELRQATPAGLLEMMMIPGLGAKRVRAIHVELGVASVDELEAACRDGRIREIAGFGETTERRLLARIERGRASAARFLRPLVDAEAERLLEVVRSARGVVRAEVGGSVRRRAETSKDIDIVVSAEDPVEVMNAFVGAGGVEEVTGRGPTKCSVRLAAGPSADLRVVPDESFPFALVYFTGNKAHNIALRARAQRSGCTLNEYALTSEETGESVEAGDEAAVYRALGLEWIPPELRLDQGEVEAAEAGKLPTLVELDDLQGILHVHSTWSDGEDSIEALAAGAIERGFRYLGVCDHSRAAVYAGGLDERALRRQHREIDGLNAKLGDAFRILKGIEVDILPDGSLDFSDDVLAGFDLVVAAVHGGFTLSRDAQTRRILRALESPYVDMLAHPTGRILLSRNPYPLDLERVLDRAVERDVAVEINSHPKRLDLDWRGLRYGLRRGMKTAVNPDAHRTAGLDAIRYGIDVARRGWCAKDDVVNAWPLDRLLDWLRRRRKAAARAGGAKRVTRKSPRKTSARGETAKKKKVRRKP